MQSPVPYKNNGMMRVLHATYFVLHGYFGDFFFITNSIEIIYSKNQHIMRMRRILRARYTSSQNQNLIYFADMRRFFKKPLLKILALKNFSL